MSKVNLHLGSGNNVIKGWINYDIDPEKGAKKLDLRKGLPHADNSVDLIFSEHVIEHFTKADGEKLLRECHRVLKKDGGLRIGWPGLEKLLKAYLLRNNAYKNHVTPHIKHNHFHTWDELFSDSLFSWEHKYAYTSRHLKQLARFVGFRDVKSKKYGDSDYNIVFDIRDDPATTYIEARK